MFSVMDGIGGKFANKKWESLELVMLSVNQGRLRFFPDESIVFRQGPNGDLIEVSKLRELKVAPHECPRCKFRW